MLWFKLLIVALLLASVVSLFLALTSMLRGNSASGKTVRALAWRVGFSVAVFLLLVLSMYMGWVEPHGVQQAQVESSASVQN